jgi:hypothetical protein
MIFGKDSRQGREQDYSGQDHSVLPGGTRASRTPATSNHATTGHLENVGYDDIKDHDGRLNRPR